MYTYGMKLRPPDIGCLPKEDLKNVNFSEFISDGRHYWGSATYERELTKEEQDYYDMEYLRGILIYGIRED